MKQYIIITIFSILVLIYIFFYNNEMFLQFSAIASIVGLLIVIYQIIKLKKITEITKNVAEEAKSKIFFFDLASKIPKTIKIIEQIRDDIRNKKINYASIRIDELSSSLVEINNCKIICSMEENLNKLTHLVQEVNKAKKIIDNAIMESKIKTIKREQINDLFNDLKHILLEINTKIQQTGGEHNGLKRRY